MMACLGPLSIHGFAPEADIFLPLARHRTQLPLGFVRMVV